MATAPTSIKVLVVPADGTDLRCETFGTVEEEIKPPTFPSEDPDIPLDKRFMLNLAWGQLQATIGGLHMVAHWKGFPQPEIRRLPEVKGHWPAEAWEKRAVIGCHYWHILFTTHTTGDLKTNPHVGHCVSGDVFVLWISGTENAGGLKFYVDVKPELFDQDWLGSVFPSMFSQLKPVESGVNAPQ